MGSKSKKFSEKYFKQNGVDAESVKEEYVDKISHLIFITAKPLRLKAKMVEILSTPN